jgi:hypothetical protein
MNETKNLHLHFNSEKVFFNQELNFLLRDETKTFPPKNFLNNFLGIICTLRNEPSLNI